MYWDRFDICEAYYGYATVYHEGQNSPAYRLFSVFDRLPFTPRDSATHTPEALSENGGEIFDGLVENPGKIRFRH